MFFEKGPGVNPPLKKFQKKTLILAFEVNSALSQNYNFSSLCSAQYIEKCKKVHRQDLCIRYFEKKFFPGQVAPLSAEAVQIEKFF